MKRTLISIFGILTLIVMVLPMAMPTPVLAADTGWHNPSANAATSGGDGNGFEVNPTYAYADGAPGVAASMNCDCSSGCSGDDTHLYYNYDFTDIPAGATINGVEVRLDWYLDSNFGTNSMIVDLSWNGGTSWSSAKTDNSEPTSETTVYLGGSGDTWGGHTWTTSDFTNANFRVRIECDDGSSTSYDRDFYLDWVPVKVYYSTCTGLKNPAISIPTAGFTNTNQAFSDSGNYATATNGESCHFFDYDFSSIPAGATITGITVRLDAWRQSGGGSNGSLAVELTWDAGTSWTTTGYTTGALSQFETTYTLGGNTWGSHTWTRTELTSTFRVKLTASTNTIVYLDWVPVTVCYTVPACINYYHDNDDDNYGAGAAECLTSPPAYNYATVDGDCDDGNAAINPGATEITCNQIDDDCNPATLDNPNNDGDSYGVCDGDCNDSNPNVNPGATEICDDQIDNDCDGDTDIDDSECTCFNLEVQLAMVMDGSSSITSGNWTIMINGLAAAVENGTCVPHDGSVELTVIQFGGGLFSGSPHAQVEIGPVIITADNYDDVADDIRLITQMGGYTPLACGINLAAQTIFTSTCPAAKQVINVVTDGVPNACCDSGSTTQNGCYDCSTDGCTDAKNSAEAARNYAIGLGVDEIDAEFIGVADGASTWLISEIVYPDPGYEAPPFTGGGWLRVVDDFQEFADTICEKFQIVICGPEICNNGIDDDCDGYIDCADSDCPGCAVCNMCSGGQCVPDANQNGNPCATSTFDTPVRYCYTDGTIHEHTLEHFWTCYIGTCTENTRWTNDHQVEVCAVCNMCDGGACVPDPSQNNLECAPAGNWEDRPDYPCQEQRQIWTCNNGQCESSYEYRNKEDGTDCGDCSECVAGVCTPICGDCETCTSDVCVDSCSADAGTDSIIRVGESAVLGGAPTSDCSECTYSWLPIAGLNDPTLPNPTASPTATTTYTVTVTQKSCTYTDTVLVTVMAAPPGGGSAAGPETYYLIVDMLGKRTYVEMNHFLNLTNENCRAFDEETDYLLSFPEGTEVLCGECDGSGCYPKIIVMSPSEETLTPPEGMAFVGPVFDFTGYKDTLRKVPCHLVTYFDPTASVLLNYDPGLIPEGGTNPVIGFYNHSLGQWVLLPPDSGVVAEVGVATGLTGYFASPFAVLVDVPPATPATPEPTPPTPEPAHFVASGLNITPAEVKAGENVTISLNVVNDGETAGSYLVELKINGNVIDSKTVTLNGGQSEAVSFTVSSAEAGTYEATASGLNGSFTVEAASNWWIYLIIAAVVVLGGVLVLLVRKRA